MKKLLLAMMFVLTTIIATSQTFTSTATGSWTTGSTWVGGTAPTLSGGGGNLNNNVTIDVGDIVTITGNLTVKNGITLTVRGKLIVSSGGSVDFQNGSIILVESGGILEMHSLNNSNNSTNVTINGSLVINGNYQSGAGSSLEGNGQMEVAGTSSGSGTSFGVVLGCDNCMVMSGGIIEDAIIDGNQTTQSAPIEPYYRYTYSQQIYYQSEINQEGNINQLSFEFNGYSSINFDVEVYLGHTTKTAFSNTTNWVAYSDLTLVYDGVYSVSNTAGWYSLTFSTPFYYNNMDNLVIAVKEKSYAYQSSSNEFYTGDGSVYRVLTYYGDATVPNPSSPPTATYRSVWVPSLKLKSEQVASPLPITLLYFKGYQDSEYSNYLHWSTASERNNDYFVIEKTKDGVYYDVVSMIPGAGNSSSILYYDYIDMNITSEISYYRLKQIDYDGKFEFSDIISIDNRRNKIRVRTIVKVINLYGSEVDIKTSGILILIYDDGSIKKIFNE